MTEKKTKALTLAQYETNAHDTVSTEEKWDQIDRVFNSDEFLGLLRRLVGLGRSLEGYKKAAFHGKNIAVFPEVRTARPTLEGKISYNALHGALGALGEASEVAEIVLEILEGKEAPEGVDREALFAEELGDVLWYIAVAAKTVGGLEAVGRYNNEKLAARKAERDAIKT